MIPNLNGNLSSVMNLVPLPGKMTILPLKEVGPIPIPTGLPYTVMFNPDSFQESQTLNYNEKQPQGSTGPIQRFLNIAASEISFEFLIDGTGASGEKREVTTEILAFKTRVGLNGLVHRPDFLLLAWGTFIYLCVCTNYSIKYTQFRTNGTPLRASISATFRKHLPKIIGKLEANLSSPDLSHFRTVNEGDDLPNLCYDIYDSPRFYLEVARANDLISFRPLLKGARLRFPPIEK